MDSETLEDVLEFLKTKDAPASLLAQVRKDIVNELHTPQDTKQVNTSGAGGNPQNSTDLVDYNPSEDAITIDTRVESAFAKQSSIIYITESGRFEAISFKYIDTPLTSVSNRTELSVHQNNGFSSISLKNI